MLQDSKSSEEALIKCCTHFSPSGQSATPQSTCMEVIEFRKEQKQELEDEIVASVAAAIRQQERIEKEQPGWKAIQKEETGEMLNPVSRYLEQVRTSRSILHGADEDIHELVKMLVAQAEEKVCEDPDCEDAEFADVVGRLAATNGNKKRKVSAEDQGKITESADGSRKQIMFEMKKKLRDHIHR